MTNFGWNYPPGAANDPRAPYNQPDHSHEHEWIPNDPDYPLFEDGAAMFSESCEYAEGQWGEGWQCEESRWLRCDLDRIILVRPDEPNVTYLESEDDHHNRFGPMERKFEDALVSIEIADYEEQEILALDPPNDYGDGYVKVKVGRWILVYKQ